MSFIRTRQVQWKKWSWVWGSGVLRGQVAVLSGMLGLGRDLPGLVKFEERLEGGEKVGYLQISTGRLN